MAEVKWIKLASDVFDNRKIRMIETMPDGDSIICIWMKILCLAGNINDNGLIYFTPEIPYTDQMLAAQFNRPLTTVQMAINVFNQYGMIDLVDDIIHVSNWERYQNQEGLDRIREQTRQRVAKHREQKKICNVTGNVTVTDCNATDIDKNKNKNENKSNTFVRPSLDEVKAYCQERGNKVNPDNWYDYYSSNGWKVGKNAMKDWKASVRTWERNGINNKQPVKEERDASYDLDAYKEQAIKKPVYRKKDS